VVEPDLVPRIYVLAGVNGAGKSSIAGAAFDAGGGEYFNPDTAARRIRKADPSLGQVEANSAALHLGKRLLQRAIAERLDFAFETTLGGNTICRLLGEALTQGIEVRMWYAGLSSPELHIARVQSRYMRGGHDIDEADIRKRYETSRVNLVHLLPRLTELRVYDNSLEADPQEGTPPRLQLVLHLSRGRILNPRNLDHTPQWAKPIVAAALHLGEP
jgi:predicted ABC-type ATPase